MSSQPRTAVEASPAITIRKAAPEDAPACGKICYEAFHNINTAHVFPPDFPSAEVAAGLLSGMFAHPRVYCVVAELDGRVAGSNCLDERTSIAGVGPITVDPSAQNRQVGRRLMEAVLERARECNFAGVRLLQATFHNRSLSLYTKLGFEVREPVSVLQGRPLNAAIAGCLVRPARASDLEECNRVCAQVHGHHRGGELAEAIAHGTARVVERHGRITGYVSNMAFFGHAAAETTLDLQALIAAAESFGGPGILVPTRNTVLLRWCLDSGLRIVQPLSLMTIGLYNEPVGAYLPSIIF